MKMIKISFNELENSIYKAAESHFFTEGFCVSSMKAIGYLEAIGLPFIETFLQFLENSDREYPKLKMVQTTDNNLEVDFQNTNSIYYAENIANFILENIKQKKKIFLKNTSDCIFLLPQFLNQNLDFSIYFRFQNKEHSITAVVPPKTHHPKLIYQKPEPYFKTGIFLFTSEEEIPKDNVLCIQTAVELTSLFQRNLNQGISISKQLWNRLTKQAKKVLVQSTVESREGAGEDKNLVDPEDITTF